MIIFFLVKRDQVAIRAELNENVEREVVVFLHFCVAVFDWHIFIVVVVEDPVIFLLMWAEDLVIDRHPQSRTQRVRSEHVVQVSHEIISLVQPVAGTLMLLSSVDFDDANVCAVDPVVTHLEKICPLPKDGRLKSGNRGNAYQGYSTINNPTLILDSDLEVFSHNPSHGSFTTLVAQLTVFTNYVNKLFL